MYAVSRTTQWAALVVVALAAGGCFKPKVKNRSFVCDATSPLATAVGRPAWQVVTPWEGSAAEQAKAILRKGTSLVSAFHTVSAEALQDLGYVRLCHLRFSYCSAVRSFSRPLCRFACFYSVSLLTMIWPISFSISSQARISSTIRTPRSLWAFTLRIPQRSVGVNDANWRARPCAVPPAFAICSNMRPALYFWRPSGELRML